MRVLFGLRRIFGLPPFLLAVGLALACMGGSVPVLFAQTTQPGVLQSWVTDPQHVLAPDEKVALEQRLEELSQTLPNKPQIAIDLPGHVDDIDSYANAVFHKTGLGQKGQDNGVLIVLALEDHQARIEVGYGLEGILTDLQSNDILRAARPALRAGHYAEALNGMLESLADILKEADPEPLSPHSSQAQNDAWEGVGGVVVAVLLLVVLPLWLIRRARKKAAQKPGYVSPQSQTTSVGWDFWLNLILNILAAFLQSGGRGGGSRGGGGGFSSGGGDSGGGGSRESW